MVRESIPNYWFTSFTLHTDTVNEKNCQKQTPSNKCYLSVSITDRVILTGHSNVQHYNVQSPKHNVYIVTPDFFLT